MGRDPQLASPAGVADRAPGTGGREREGGREGGMRPAATVCVNIIDISPGAMRRRYHDESAVCTESIYLYVVALGRGALKSKPLFGGNGDQVNCVGRL